MSKLDNTDNPDNADTADTAPEPTALVTTQPWWKSRQIRLAALQALAGTVGLFVIGDWKTSIPVAIAAYIKSFIDIYLRLTSVSPIINPLTPTKELS